MFSIKAEFDVLSSWTSSVNLRISFGSCSRVSLWFRLHSVNIFQSYSYAQGPTLVFAPPPKCTDVPLLAPDRHHRGRNDRI
jgi:hypothetical protein